jgi:hypothetical protein
MAQPAIGEPQPAPFAVDAEQHLGDGQTDQLGVAELWLAAGAGSGPNRSSMMTYSAVTRVSRSA